ncbi:MAG: heme ABC transporter permease [Pseudomonadota bacterium]|nr:heme ABC transporter permease [Pseudomonadota bacterium]MED5430567.1 heme ABC transporter permease [Pseudomonadota bacterium]|tara:strand:- start:85 stop:810 length:726 start_codon:yes stop_codon:yes gene_type:complete
MLKNIFNKISPNGFYFFVTQLIPWLLSISFILISYGIYQGLFVAPPDYQQGDAFRIMYVHVPSAWLSLFAYSVLAFCSIVSLVWRIKVFEILSISSAKIGALFTFLTLVTGAIWGKPMWGTWWVWDARLTSELILFFIYISIILLNYSFDDYKKGARAANILAIVGLINIPIIHFSVEWWNTLHQGPSVIKLGSPSISTEMLIPLIYVAVGFTFYFFASLFLSARNILLVRERHKSWVKNI